MAPVQINNNQLSNLLEIVENLEMNTFATRGFIKQAMKNDGILQIWTEPSLTNFTNNIAVLIKTNLPDYISFHYISTNDQLAFDLLEACIDWSKNEFLFESIYSENIKVLHEIASEHICKSVREDVDDIYVVFPEKLKMFPIPDQYKEDNVTAYEVDRIYEKWPYSYLGSYGFIRWYAQNGPIVALRDCQDNLVAYEMTSTFGTQCLLHVEKNHRRKGLASSVISSLASKILKNNHYSYATICENNAASIQAHLKCGFQKLEKENLSYISFKKV